MFQSYGAATKAESEQSDSHRVQRPSNAKIETGSAHNA
jgi:hypothetical protein